MKIALAQINSTVGAVPDNTRRILEWIDRAAEKGADLVVFPELAVTGYPPNDLLEHRSLTQASLDALQKIAESTSGEGRPGVIVGYLDRNEDEGGKTLYNAAALLAEGRIVSRHTKSLLPTYDVFDEARYFEPAAEVHTTEFRGHRLAVTICEDFWNDRLYWKRRSYLFDPVEELAKESPDLMITISASPFWIGKARIRDEMYSAATKRYGIPLVHLNMVAGNDSLVFDGRSNVWGADGRKLAEAKAFEEELKIVDLDNGSPAEAIAPDLDENEEIYRALILGVKDYVRKCGFKHVLIGLSGGIDSALTAALAVDALGPEAVTGVAMPSEFSSEHSVTDAKKLAENLGIRFHVLPIKPIYEEFIQTLDPMFKGTGFNVAEENIQARTRGTLLMALSNKFDWLVLTTGNKSELAVGYCTLYGDMSGGLAVISDLLKTRVYALSRWMNRDGEKIPVDTIEKPPSAELRPGQLDSDSLPPYDVLDPIVEAYVEKHLHAREIIEAGGDPEIVSRIVRMIDRNEYKRQQAAPGIKITTKAFGIGRRMPIARGDWA